MSLKLDIKKVMYRSMKSTLQKMVMNFQSNKYLRSEKGVCYWLLVIDCVVRMGDGLPVYYLYGVS